MLIYSASSSIPISLYVAGSTFRETLIESHRQHLLLSCLREASFPSQFKVRFFYYLKDFYQPNIVDVRPSDLYSLNNLKNSQELFFKCCLTVPEKDANI